MSPFSTLWTIVGLVCISHAITVLAAMQPQFDEKIKDLVVTEKDTAILPCSVINLGKHEVVWTDQYSTLLTHEDRRIIDDERLSVERPYNKDWNLHIRDVRYSDQGLYNCQINTDPIKIKLVNLTVWVPSKIVNSLSTRNVTIQEGEKVTLVCNATGYPTPTVSWYRLVKNDKGEDKQSELCPGSKQIGKAGEVLVIYNVTRFCGGNYQCVAYNDVEPAATRVIDVSVRFSPEVNLPNYRIGQDIGKDTILECVISAHPMSDVWWKKDGKKISSDGGGKYRVEIYDETSDRLTLTLRIFDLTEEDFGTYTCYASNRQGQAEENMNLYDYGKYLRTTTTTTTAAATSTIYYITQRSHAYYHNRKNTNERQHYRGQGEGYNQGYQQGQGQGQKARPGSQIYTPRFHNGNKGNIQASKNEGIDRNRACQIYSNGVTILVSIVLTFCFMTTASPSFHL